MNDLIVNEIKKNHNEAEQYIYLFLVGIDAVTFIGAIIFFGFEIENFDSPRHKLFTILFLDIFVEIISIFTDAYMNNLLQETVFTLILAIQFYLYLQIIERVF